MAVVKIKSKTTKAKPAPSKGAGNANSDGTSRRNADAGDEVTEAALLKLVPGGLAATFVKQKLHDKRLEVAGLAPPVDWDGEMPDLPNDVATVDHGELSNLLARFTNVQSTALWHASTAYIEAGFYEEIADYLENVALLNTDQSNDTKRKADARTSDPVMAARTLHRNAYSDYVRFRDFSRTCELRWRTVSRIGGFVGDEAESEEASVSRASTRGRTAGAAKAKSKGMVRRTAKR